MSLKRKIPFSFFLYLSRLKRLFHPFKQGFPLSNADSNQVLEANNAAPPFFIVGSGRSGNTLVRRMLDAGGEVCIPPESYILARATRKFLKYNYRPWTVLATLVVDEFQSHPEFALWELNLDEARQTAIELEGENRNFFNIIDSVYRSYAARNCEENKRWGDKTPTNALFLDHICYAFPNAQFIHLIRDPRAVFASYIKSGLLPASTIADKNRIINLWLDSHKKIQYCKKKFNSAQFIAVHYEKLVDNASVELQKICKHLGISYEYSMLNYWQNESGGDIKQRAHHLNTTKPVSSASLEKWKDSLSLKEVNLIEKRCMPLYNELLSLHPLNRNE